MKWTPSPAGLAIAGLVVVSAVARTWAASMHAGPAYFPDEYIYTELSRSIAATGHADVRGAPAHFMPLLASLVTAPAWLFGSVATGYRVAQAIDACCVSLAAIPVYVLARLLRINRRRAVAAAALSLALPGLLYTSFMLSEPVAYPLVLAAVAAGVHALARPSARRIAFFAVFVLLASFARLQFAVLLPCFLVAFVAMLACERRLAPTLRRHWRAAGVLVIATVALAIAGPARSTGYYPSFLHVSIDVPNVVSSLGLNALILAIGTGLVLLPGSVLGLSAAIAQPRQRAELAFGALALTVSAAVLLQASIYGDTHVAQTRYTFYLAPIWILAFFLYAARGWEHRRAFSLLALGLLTAALTTPLTTAAYGHGKVHSPELFAVARIEQAFNGVAGRTSSAIFLVLSGGVAVVTATAWLRPRLATAAAFVFAAACMGVLSVGAYAFDAANTRAVRQAFAGSDPSWIDNLHLGLVHMVLTPNDLTADPLEQMFWNRSVDRAVLLPDTRPPDTLPAAKGTVTGDGALLDQGRPLTGPALIDEYSTSVELRNAKTLGSDPTSVLYRPDHALDLRLLAIGEYDRRWLGERGALVVWPTRIDGKVDGKIVLHLSLPAHVPAIGVDFRAKHLVDDVSVRGGAARTADIPVCGTGPVDVLFAAQPSGRLGDGRLVSVRSQPPVFDPSTSACRRGAAR